MVPEIEPGLGECKVSALSPVLSFWPFTKMLALGLRLHVGFKDRLGSWRDN